MAAITLALGIGVNASVFSLLNALLLRPLAGPGVFAIYRGSERPASYPDAMDFQRRSSSFAGLAAAAPNESALDAGDTSEVILAEAVSYNFAEVLGLRTALGRWFAPADEHGTIAYPAVLSHRIWQTRFGGDSGVIGKQVRLESQSYTVVGVAPREFQGMALPIVTGVWVPLPSYARHNGYAARLLTSRDGKALLFGRLKPGVSEAQAQAELNALDEELRREHPRQDARRTALRLELARGSADPAYRRPVGQLLMLLTGVAAVVLAIGCANVANLLLARGVSRRREISVRMALGASRARICRQLLAECALLSLIGAAAGLAAAQWTNRLLENTLASASLDVAVAARLSLDPRVFGLSLAVSVAAMLLFGLFPALQASKPDLALALRGIGAHSRGRWLTAPNASVVAQVALSLSLLIVAGLFVRALERAHRLDPGFDAGTLLSARIYVSERDFEGAAGMALFRRAVDRVEALPGVRGATLSYSSPTAAMSRCAVPDEPSPLPGSVRAGANAVGSGYFATYGIPLLRGRDFNDGDRAQTPAVAIVNEAFAQRYWPDGEALGRRIRTGPGCEKGQGSIAEIVGVVKDAQYAAPGSAGRPFVFFPLEQQFAGYVALVARTGAGTAGLAGTFRRELRALDPRLRVYEIDTVAGQIDKSLWQLRWEAALVGVLGVLALGLAFVGLYGVISFAAGKRTREYGIRMALGAKPRQVLGQVAGDAMVLTLAGAAIGLALSFAGTRLLSGFLHGLSPTDTVTYAGSALLWIVSGMAASCAPAWRAARTDPAVTLRNEQ